jgi:hypothetical protein
MRLEPASRRNRADRGLPWLLARDEEALRSSHLAVGFNRIGTKEHHRDAEGAEVEGEGSPTRLYQADGVVGSPVVPLGPQGAPRR